MKTNSIKVVELFAGVGGFRVGLEKNNYEIIWSNQWEPSTKKQYASMIYEARFGKENHSNKDIETIPTSEIPDHDLLCGGFPCQDYSVASTLNNSKGIKGKKGVLWWSIYRILQEKKNKPKYLLLENVDRLLKSPAKQKGRDFAIILQSLNQLGYAVEWRVINAADYGMPQRRKRVFFIGYLNSTYIYNNIQNSNKLSWLTDDSPITKAFPVSLNNSPEHFYLSDDIIDISENFNKISNSSQFLNTGVMIDGNIFTIDTKANYDGQRMVLGDIIQKDEIPAEFFIDKNDMSVWEYLKGTKSIERISKDGHKYKYTEGSMTYPDSLDRPSRTIITAEGGKTPSRFKHVISTTNGLRRLTPVELERLNMFPDNHTKLEGISDTKRAFFMGNALVTGVVERLGQQLYHTINAE